MARVYRSADRSLAYRRVTLPGERMIGDDSPLGNLITMRYYAEIAAKLAQPILAAALVEDFTVPEEIQFPAFVWEFRFGPADGLSAVSARSRTPIRALLRPAAGSLQRTSFRPDMLGTTFFGVEVGVFTDITRDARHLDASNIGFRKFRYL